VIRVLHLITTLQAGGAQTMLTNLVSHGDGDALRHVVVDMLGDDDVNTDCAARIRACGVPVHSLGMTRGRASAAAVGRFIRLLRSERPTLVQTWLYHADLLGLAAVPAARLPVVWNIRSAWHQGIKRLTPRVCALLSRMPAAVVVNSEAGRAVHEAIGYRPRRWCLIGNGFDLDVFKPDEQARASVRAELGLDSGTPLIGLIGRWDPHKDHQTFLAGAALVAARDPNVRFVLVGDGVSSDNPVLLRMLEDAGVAARVHLLGSRKDIARITAALDVAACTSIGEAFPNVVGEAMAAGVPCVATDVGDAAKLVGEMSMIVPPRDAPRLAAAWSNVLAMSLDERRKLGLEARARISERYSLAAIVQQYEALYQDLVQ